MMTTQFEKEYQNFDWSKIPPRFWYATIDADGTKRAFVNKPKLSAVWHIWDAVGEQIKIAGHGTTFHFSAYRTSLRERPLFYCDNKRHLVCVPYSIENLHRMAMYLEINRCWFHKTHYDIPKMRIKEIQAKCRVVSPKDIVRIIKGEQI